MSTNIRFISAGAGSGKTYRLTELLKDEITEGRVAPAGVIGTTFTKKAAVELRERVRRHLFEAGRPDAAVQMEQALLGTVNSVCGQLLARFSFELGLSPDLEVIPEEETQTLFDQLLETVVSLNRLRRLNEPGNRLELHDWKSTVKDIVTTARANDMNSEAVHGFGRGSADELLGFFPKPKNKDPYPELLTAVDTAIVGIETNDDSTMGSQNYLAGLRQIRSDIAEKSLSWRQWVKLSKDKPTKKSQALAEAVQEAAAQYDSHPLLHADIRELCTTVFAVAGDATAAYQEFKTKRGLIDFVDQEQLMLIALDRPEVFGVIEGELDLLLVDEFQDTSPIQLALFLKLAEAADEAIFVGDIKQAIYGFRGSDPELMQAVLKKVEAVGGRKEILDRSYRSRPHLVEYVNAVFTHAFGDTILEDQILLTPARSDPQDMRDETAVEKWELKGRSIPVRARELGQGVLELVNSGRRVTDPTTKQPRSVRFSDIAVFARSHLHIAPLAEAFAALGIPVDLERPGLLGTPEVCLTLACMRRLVDPSDTLASAEIVALSSGEEPETWLSDRLEYLANGGNSYRWGEDGTYPLLQRIAMSRDRLQFLTPAEAVTYAIDIADLRRLVTTWGPDDWSCNLRLNNLDGLVDLARQYEDQCRTQRQAATLGGLLLWLEDLKQKKQDARPKNLGGDAVTLSTHHGAKGQEWPVVIATDLADNIWRRLWDLNAVSGCDSIDLENPLAGRLLRYWPWPFGAQKAGIAVAERVEASSWGRASLLRDTEEEKRVLYVSLSRARDLLILPFYSKKPRGPWIDSLGADWMVPSGDRLRLSEGLEIPTAVREYEAAEDDVAAAIYEPFWFDERASVTEKLAKKVSPSELSGIETSSIVAVETISIGISVKGHPDMSILGDVMHIAISLQIIDPKQFAFPDLVRSMLEEKGLDGSVEINEIVQEIKEFIKFINAKFDPQRVWAEHPMTHVWETGQVAKGWIDVLLETESGLIVIDHKTTRDDPKPVVAKCSGQLLAYKQAVEAATGKPADIWIHFPLSGEMLNINY